MNLYIFSKNCRGAIFGVGTYIRELTFALKNNDIHISVVNLLSDRPQIEIAEIEGIIHWYIPKPLSKHWSVDDKEQWRLYFHNFVYFCLLYTSDAADD